MSDYKQNMSVFKTILEVNIPLASVPQKHITLLPNDIIVCLDESVWLPDHNNEEGVMTKALISAKFVKANDKIFTHLVRNKETK